MIALFYEGGESRIHDPSCKDVARERGERRDYATYSLTEIGREEMDDFITNGELTEDEALDEFWAGATVLPCIERGRLTWTP